MRNAMLIGALSAALFAPAAQARDAYYAQSPNSSLTVHWTEGGRASRARPYAMTWLEAGKVHFFSHEELLAANYSLDGTGVSRDAGSWTYADPGLAGELGAFLGRLKSKREAQPELDARLARLRQTLAGLKAYQNATLTAQRLGGKRAPDLDTLLIDAERWIDGVAKDAAAPFLLENGKPVGRFWEADRTLGIPQHQLGRAEYLLDEAAK